VFWGKAKKVEELVLRHLKKVDESLASFEKALMAYVVEQDYSKAKKLALDTHVAEGKADDIRREVETRLLGGALLAPSRRDILNVIEQVDRLANSGEAVLDRLLLERIEVPEEIRPAIEEISKKTREIIDDVNAAVGALFHDIRRVVEYTKRIEHGEGEVDHLERKVLKALFKMDIDLAHKLQLRDFIEELVELSDRAEDLSDLLDVLVAEGRY